MQHCCSNHAFEAGTLNFEKERSYFVSDHLCTDLQRTADGSAVPMKARKIRQRSVALADDDNQNESAAEAVRKSIAARKQQTDKKANQKPLLSFDDEDETHVAPVKRAPAKLKPDLKGLKLASDAAKTSTQRSAPGRGALLLTFPDRQNETSFVPCAEPLRCRRLLSGEVARAAAQHQQASPKQACS